VCVCVRLLVCVCVCVYVCACVCIASLATAWPAGMALVSIRSVSSCLFRSLSLFSFVLFQRPHPLSHTRFTLFSSQESLREYFGNFGAVVEVRVVTDSESKKTKGFGFVQLASKAAAEAALAQANGFQLDGV
jgi:hypothetical protein